MLAESQKREQVLIASCPLVTPSSLLRRRLIDIVGYAETKRSNLVVVVVLIFTLTQYAGLAPIRAEYHGSTVEEDNRTHSNGKQMLSSSSWLSGWEFRKAHLITGSAGAGNNYQVKIVVHYGPGSDSWADVYCNHNCQSNFGDIRFTADDGISLLHFWREEVVASDHAVFWVQITGNLSLDVSIYVYYGNPTAVSTTNGDATFIFFDDFESGAFNPSKWEDPGEWQIVNTSVHDGLYAAYCNDWAHNQTLWCNLTSKNLNNGFILHVWTRSGAVGQIGACPGDFMSSAGHEVRSVVFYNGQFCYQQQLNPTPWPANNGVSESTYYRIEVGLDFQDSIQRCWKNGNYMGEVELHDIYYGVLYSGVTGITCYSPRPGVWGGQNLYLDDCYIRKWIPNEPQHGPWGLEQGFLDISHPADVHMNETDTGRSITWVLSGLHPADFEVRRNSTLVASGPWNSTGEHITVSLDGLSPGAHEYNATIVGGGGNTVSDVVLVTVDRVSVEPQASWTTISITIGCLAVIVILLGLIYRSRDDSHFQRNAVLGNRSSRVEASLGKLDPSLLHQD